MNRTLLGFIRKELIQALRDPRMKFILFVAPVVQMTIFGVAISNEVKNIRLAAFFSPQDTVLRDVYERAIHGGWFVPAGASGAVAQDPFELIRADKADAVLVAPEGGFTRALGRGNARLQLLVDATNVTQAQSIEGYIQAIVARTLAADLGALPARPPIRFDLRVLFNPSLDTAIFMVPGVMTMLMVLTTLVLTNIAIVREKELGTFEMLISAPVSRTEVILGKTLPYVVIGMTNLPLTLAVAVFVFHVPMRGSMLALVVATLAFVCTTVAMGTLISTYCDNQQQASMGGFLFMFPAIMFSGLMFPIENMPASVRWLAFIDPLAHYLSLLRNIMLKGGGAETLIRHSAALLLLALVSGAASFKRFHTTLR
ncbi:MAG: ABC transporter permease [Elusimicrobia bacterium]|nr:ABC transporter permease [Elusimicrobiota bacterium]MDE2237415.1 ABC transporter permease [Elusimicrobiota bacterium]MDE2426808.1 ABC transporter permease [Elusimicrobiota bacterium]